MFFSLTHPSTASLLQYIIFFILFGVWSGTLFAVLARVFSGPMSWRRVCILSVAGGVVAMSVLILVWAQALTPLSFVLVCMVTGLLGWYVQQYKRIK